MQNGQKLDKRWPHFGQSLSGMFELACSLSSRRSNTYRQFRFMQITIQNLVSTYRTPNIRHCVPIRRAPEVDLENTSPAYPFLRSWFRSFEYF